MELKTLFLNFRKYARRKQPFQRDFGIEAILIHPCGPGHFGPDPAYSTSAIRLAYILQRFVRESEQFHWFEDFVRSELWIHVIKRKNIASSFL